MRERKLKLSINRNLALALLVFLILPALIAGYTYAVVAQPGWFTDETKIDTNTFTAGTLLIDVDDPLLFDAQFNGPVNDISFDPCAGLSYLITNGGTKRNYVRVKFEGGWQRVYHINTATASVAGIEKSDSAHFRYGTSIFSPPLGSIGEFGFTDSKVLGPVEFDPITVEGSGISSGYNFQPDSYVIDSSIGNGGAVAITAPGEELKISDAGWPGFISGPNQDNKLAALKNLFGPDCLSKDNSVKFEVEGANLNTGDTRVLDNITITKEADGTFSFTSTTHRIYHVFVKGGADKSNLYTYYVKDSMYELDEDGFYNIDVSSSIIPFEDNTLRLEKAKLSENGVTYGSGLSQDGGGWSHIEFFYCDPPSEPGLEIVKLVSLDNGNTWFTDSTGNTPKYDAILNLLRGEPYNFVINEYDYSNFLSWPQEEGQVPKFKIIVANTGNVQLNGIQVNDSFFAGYSQTFNLAPGQIWFGNTISYLSYNTNLDTGVISIKLADPILSIPGWDPTEWYPYDEDTPTYQNLGDYFYYKNEISAIPPGQVPLYVNICLNNNNLSKEYNGAVFKLYTYFEAIQFTNQMDMKNWELIVQALE